MEQKLGDENPNYLLKRLNIWLASRNSRAVGVTVLGGKYLRRSVSTMKHEGGTQEKTKQTNQENVGTADDKGIGYRLFMQRSKELKTPDPLHAE
jgi:hypothetical protein